MSLTWNTKPTALDLTGFADRLTATVADVARESALAMEAYARLNAPWTDDTGFARNGLVGSVQAGPGVIALEIAHSAEYGQFLELRWPKDTPPPELDGFTLEFLEAGRYAILWPTVEQEIPQLMARLREVLR